jgi:hypothetical protein
MFRYRLWVKNPWDKDWQEYNYRRYLSKWTAALKVYNMRNDNWVTDRTQFKISRRKPHGIS